MICDLAETYGIYDYRRLPVKMVASFVVGLRADSRTKMKINHTETNNEMVLLASIVDRLGILIWQQTENGRKGRNKPAMIMDVITKTEEKPCAVFSSAEKFEEAKKKIIERSGEK